jgi:hypothetical protein
MIIKHNSKKRVVEVKQPEVQIEEKYKIIEEEAPESDLEGTLDDEFIYEE